MIKYRIGQEIDMIRLVELFNEAGSSDKTIDYKSLASIVENSDLVITAWDFDYMIGFARLNCDEASDGLINNVVVDKEYINQGIDKELVSRIIKKP